MNYNRHAACDIWRHMDRGRTWQFLKRPCVPRWADTRFAVASLSGGSGGGFIILPIPTRATCTAVLKKMEMDKNSTAQPLWNRITVVPIEKKA